MIFKLKNIRLIVILLSFFSVFISLNSCSNKLEKKERSLIYKIDCQVDPSKGNQHSHSHANLPKYDIELKGKITTTEFHSAPASVMMTGKVKFSFNSVIDSVKKGQFYKVSVWRKLSKKEKKKNANLIIEGHPKGRFYKNQTKVVEKDKNGWEKLQISFEVPDSIDYLKIYTYLSESDTAYFDDFSIEYFDYVENSIKNSSSSDIIYKIECKANKLAKKVHNHEHINGQDLDIKLNGTITNKEFHSSPTSVFINKKNGMYSFVTTIDDIKTDQLYRISIWRKDNSKNKSNLIVEGSPVHLMYLNKPQIVEIDQNGWEKLVTEFEVPPGLEEIKIYTYLSEADSAYYDDLTIELLADKKYPAYANEDKLHLYFSDDDMQAFEKERKEAFYEGVHFSADQWRKAVLSDESKVIPIKTRLKGDWLDHLQGRKWSFRIKTRKGKVFRRMKTFSIQNPETRYFFHEYLSHKLFSQEDILTTRYDFSPVYINRQSLGIYAIEEHFAKQLIEYNLRREGPILKFDEDPLWRSNSVSTGVGKLPWRVTANYDVSRILPFDKGSIEDNPVLYDQFQIAHSLVYQFKNREADISELLDIDKFAKYYALLDLINGKHGLTWHNQRYYYNPVISKIEPINFDNFTDYFKEEKDPRALIFRLDDGLTNRKFTNLVLYLFTSKEFIETYITYLEKYTDEKFIKTFYASQQPQIDRWLPLLQEEFPEYDIQYSYLEGNAKILRSSIPRIKKDLEEGKYDNVILSDKKREVATDYQSKTLPYFVNAYYYPKGASSEILLENYTGRTVKFEKLVDSKGRTLFRFDEGVSLSPNVNGYTDTLLKIPYFKKASKIIIADSEEDESLATELTPWPKNTSLSPYQKLIRNSNYLATGVFVESNDTIYIKAGNHLLREKVLIPKNKTFVIQAGAQIDLIDSATIISYSTLFANGTKEKPIKIYSSDKTANGFSVFQAKDKSIVNYVTFSNLNTLSYDGWRLSGAVNFYEADVDLTYCSFIENHCEDALNIIRSHFEVKHAFFNKIYADAFDSDFCTGNLEDSKFLEVDNDAIDFSTSQINITNCEIKNILDKGISGGEDSKLNVSNCTIENANIGVASKDLSIVKLSNVSINNAKYGLVALQKKAEYGSATLETKNLKLENCETKLLIEKGSTLNLNGRMILGDIEKAAEMFY